MLVRIFSGNSWSTADELGDFEFDEIPSIGHKLALSGDTWDCGQVHDIVHRVVDGDEAADVALLLGPLVSAPLDRQPLPLGLLDQAGGAAPASSSTVPNAGRRSPWGS